MSGSDFHVSTSRSLLLRVQDPEDEEAWRQFEKRYAGLIRRYCRRRGLKAADIDDVGQIAFSNLAKGLRHFSYDPAKGRFRAYLGRVVQNAISRHFSRYPTEGRRLVEYGALSNHNGRPDELWESEWVNHHYRLAMETVRQTFEERSVSIFHRLAGGESPKQVAADFDMTEAAVNQAKHRIKARMKELIERQILEEDDPKGYGQPAR